MIHTRTSQSHPLYVSDLAVGPGRLGLTICPGKKGDSVFGAPWDRDLGMDLAAVRDWGATAVLTLVEPHELRMLGVERLGEAVRALGMEWHHFPIPDLGAPKDLDRSSWWRLSTRLHGILDQGGRVLVHCRGGLGRAGTMAALLLTERGDTAQEAIARIRAVRKGAIETAVQERFLASRAALPDARTERIRASLFGGAIGDALGAAIEFWKLPQILRRFPNGVDEMLPYDGRLGAITDDTQMTLFTAEGMIRAMVRGIGKGVCHPPSVIHRALLRWYATQGARPAREVCAVGLVEDPRLHRRRSPGMTCMAALGATRAFGDVARNDSKGCGTIMRVAPVAFMGGDLGQVETIALKSSALTHGHRTGQEAAAAWALILADVLRGTRVETAALGAAERFGTETARAIRSALSAPRDGRPGTVESLGAAG
ncbi:hypothetical protein Rumeso_04406 [Rubellimicrobium mesophilum DSM 19309]|uniref:Tyrosine specific protein phosphatases domain-containing protein n=1 Tax=Rubellimicrobium mesophilum DSM 19309 TaxID=442562 RepID=A0A017HIB1_9RHOB|nr:hypothetical protein Rumeso_04406 [Rubellimicrobium mesophilum DSM 19309]